MQTYFSTEAENFKLIWFLVAQRSWWKFIIQNIRVGKDFHHSHNISIMTGTNFVTFSHLFINLQIKNIIMWNISAETNNTVFKPYQFFYYVQ